MGVGTVLSGVVPSWIIATYEFGGVMTLECFGEVIQELKKRGDIGIAEPQGQTYQWHVVWFHGGYRARFGFRAARSAALAAACS